MSSVARVSVLGDWHVARADGQAAEFRTRKSAEIVAKLCLTNSRRVVRAELASDLWPDTDRATQLHNLRPALTYARAALGGPETIITQEEWLLLNDGIESDWQEVARLEARIQQAGSDSDRLALLYALNNLVQSPLLGNWDGEWLEPIRLYHNQRRLNCLRLLSEELGSRGEWKSALDYAKRVSQIDPSSEEGIRLQLRYLGELDRTTEAQREFVLYAKQLESSLGLPVNPSLRRFAEDVISGRYRKTGSRPLTSIQQEMIWEIMSVLVEEEPDRLLPLLATSKLNWSLVFYGSEMQPILERVLQATQGWAPERCGVAKRLLQVYAQDGRWVNVSQLAQELNQAPQPIDRISALNFLAAERKAMLDYPTALELYDQAVAISESIQDRYLWAVSVANRAILNICFEVYQVGLSELTEAIDLLATRTEPNGRYSTSMAKGWTIPACLGARDLQAAERFGEDWRLFAEMNATLAFDATGKLFYGAMLATLGRRGARDWLVSGIDTAFLNRRSLLLVESTVPLVYGLHHLGQNGEAAAVSSEVRQLAKSIDFHLAPFQTRLLKSAPVQEANFESTKSASEILSLCREKLLAIQDPN
ncbi:MAG: hypothetical protein BGO01_07350 [Armatimonadetes bacterium 55-13]|nr:MAG: hypothetical protein BGO01_07350 [Armatimonadetes bacterium 55-13]